MDGKHNVPLAPYTTLHVGGSADIFYTCNSADDLSRVVTQHPRGDITVLGGGSNVLIADGGVRGVVVHMAIPGISYEECGEKIRVTAGAGELWDAFVQDTISHSCCGLENLSGIPGTVGASPVQNIGAYGSEVKDTLERVEVFNTEERSVGYKDTEACALGYRDSFFKKEQGKKFIVTRVSFLLSKRFTPNITYKDLQMYFTENVPTGAQEVRDAVLSIRSKKMPDMTACGTAGSFFKNPSISTGHFESLREKYPNIQGFPAGEGLIKIPLAWILDTILHLNGVREGNVSCFQSQPLVLCTHTGATAQEVDEFAKKIEQRVYDATGITIEREVRMLA